MTHHKSHSECYFCPEQNPDALEEHHLVPQRFNGSDEPENTVLLCGSCHDKIEELYDDTFYERLGIAVEEAKQDKLSETTSGVAIDASQSQDRALPANSPHVTIESGWVETVYITDIENGGVDDHLQQLVEGEKEKILKEYRQRESEQEPLGNYFDDQPAWVLDDGHEPVSFHYAHAQEAKYPLLKVKNPHKDRYDREARHADDDATSKIEFGKSSVQKQSGNTNPETPTPLDVEKELPTFHRIHCGYCHTAFSRHQHADAAQHLRMRHGVENPYETIDTAFANPDEGNSFLGKLGDYDE